MGLGAPCRQCDVFEVMRLDIRPPSDQMIRQAAAGDQEAFACLTRRMMPLLRSQINGLGSSGTDEDDDLFQEAMLGLLAAVRSYRPEAGASFTTYATVCVRHRLLSALRRSAPRTGREQPLDEDTPADRQPDPADLLQQQEDALRLQEQLQQQLTPLEYRVLMARLRGCSYQEIADRLEVGKKTVDNAVQRLRHKMSGLL